MSTAAIEVCPVVSSVDENGTQRITLLDGDDSVLCGAYYPPGHTQWRLYMSAALGRVGAPPALMPATHLLTQDHPSSGAGTGQHTAARTRQQRPTRGSSTASPPANPPASSTSSPESDWQILRQCRRRGDAIKPASKSPPDSGTSKPTDNYESPFSRRGAR